MPQYVLSEEFVASCLHNLRSRKVHPNFAGYLCIKRTAMQHERNKDLKPDFKEFFDTFLKVNDAPLKKPYIMPFSDSEPSEANKWFNANVAGSYAPSSLRDDGPFLKVITLDKVNKSYSLSENHWISAKKHLLFDQRLPIVPLATFLYRDFALETPQEASEPSLRNLIDVFRLEFGYADVPDNLPNSEYQHMFEEEFPAELEFEKFGSSNS